MADEQKGASSMSSGAETEELLRRERGLRERVTRSNEAKRQLLAVLARDLRPSTNAALGWVQLLQREVLDTNTRRRALETVERNIQLQARLLDELLDASRVDDVAVGFDLVPTELGRVVARAVGAALPAAAVAGVELALVEAGSVAPVSGLPVLGDERALLRMLSHLLSNAISASVAGGRIEVRLARSDRFVELIVQNEGAGIPPEAIPTLFDLSSDLEFASLGAGARIGLYVIRRLAELHGGAVRARSSGKGQGATFTVTLPMLGPEDARPSP